jgi:GT2 family glycosyltransferase
MDSTPDTVPQDASARVGVVLVTYNAERYVRQCLEALARQTFRDFSVLVIDNGSTDHTVAVVQQEFPHIRVVLRRDNLGFSRAYNDGITWASNTDYALCLNQDCFLEPDYLAELVAYADDHPRCASCSGKLLRYDPEAEEGTTVVDSMGLAIRRTQRVFNIAEGAHDDRHNGAPAQVFGLAATAVLYRRSALVEVALRRGNREEYFDEDFFAYKEDIDLAWRLQLAGYHAALVPAAVAYHVRTVRNTGFLRRGDRRPLVRQLAYRNHALAVLANQTLLNMLLLAPWWVPFELGKAVYTFIREPATFWKGCWGVIRLLPRTWSKRRSIQRVRQLDSKAIRQWFT